MSPRIIPTVLVLLVVTASVAPAQRRKDDHGFRHTNPGALTLGAYVGGQGVFATGGPTPVCNCTYDDGSGSGLHAGFVADVRVAPMGAIRLTIGSSQQTSTYVAKLTREGYRLDGSPVTVDAEHRSEVQSTYLSTGASFVWYTGPAGLYLSAGASAWFFLDGTLKETESITTPGLVYDSGSNTVVIADGDLGDEEAMDTQAGISVGAGWDIPIGGWMAIAPEVSASYPFTQVSGSSPDWRMATVRGTLLLRFGL